MGIAFSLRERIVSKAVEDFQTFVEALENQEHCISNEAENVLNLTISRLEEAINSSDRPEVKSPLKRDLEESEDDMEFKISKKRARIQHLKTNKVAVKKRMKKRLFWKWSLRSQWKKDKAL